MFNVSLREYFSVLNVFIVCIRNTARSKSIPLMCTHVDSYKFSTVHPPEAGGYYKCEGAFRVDCIIMKMESEATPKDT
jgi:hypothetical protein